MKTRVHFGIDYHPRHMRRDPSKFQHTLCGGGSPTDGSCRWALLSLGPPVVRAGSTEASVPATDVESYKFPWQDSASYEPCLACLALLEQEREHWRRELESAA